LLVEVVEHLPEGEVVEQVVLELELDYL